VIKVQIVRGGRSCVACLVVGTQRDALDPPAARALVPFASQRKAVTALSCHGMRSDSILRSVS
jgi:hypothetical protein